MFKIKGLIVIFLNFYLLMVTINSGFALEQEIPVLKDVQVKLRVTFDSASERYLYVYNIVNPSINTGKIDTFKIDLVKPVNGKDLNPEGYILFSGENFSGEKVIKSYIQALGLMSPVLKKPVVPVGMKPPFDWGSGISGLGEASWGARKKIAFILPGQTSESFELSSEGLPSIRVFAIKPWFIYSTEGEAGEYGDDLAKAEEIDKQITVTGKTVGPTAPPTHLVPVDFVTYIIDLKHQAQTLGWIGGPNFILELDKKLDQVKAKLAAGEIEPAREELGAFIEKVEAHYKETKENETEKIKKTENREKFITSEGYALLKFNAAYLRDQLGKPKEMKDDKGQKNKP